jgi:hypothetical protein
VGKTQIYCIITADVCKGLATVVDSSQNVARGVIGVYRVLVGKTEGKRPLGKPRRREDNIKIDLQEVGCGGME